MSEHNGDGSGAAPRSRAERIAQLGRDQVALVAELEALAVWAADQERRQAELEIVAAACEEERQERQRGVVWLSE